MRNNILIILILVFIFSFGCKRKKQIPFDSDKWKVKADFTFPYRNLMLNDIVGNEIFIGFNYDRLVDSLGNPENYSGKKDNEILYTVIEDYGWDIDPVYVKQLRLIIDKDSVVIDTEIYEWKK